MAITGNPGDLATGGFGTGVRGVAATPRDVANAVARGEAMAAARTGGAGGEGGNRAAGTGFRGPATTWGSQPSVVPGSALGLLSSQPASPMAPYGNAFDFTPAELTTAIKSMNKAGLPAAGAWELLGLQAALKKPDNIAMSEALGGPFAAYQDTGSSFSVPSGLLGNALDQALSPAQGVPSVEESLSGTYSGPKGVSSLTPEARMASVQSQGLNIPQVSYTPEELDAATRMVLAESSNIVNPQGGLNIQAAQAVADVVRNRVLSEQFPSTVQGVLSQPRQFEPYGSGAYMSTQYGTQNPNYNAVQDLVRGVLSGEAAPVVGGAVNFGNNAIIQGRPTASIRTQNAFAQMGADPNSVTFYSARNPASVQQTFGVLPGSRPVDFGSPVPVAARQPVPVSDLARAVMPTEQTRVAATPSLPPRTPTPSFIDRVATNLFGVPGYDTGSGILGSASKAGEYGQQLLAGSQPQVVEPTAALEAPPVNRPTASTSLASLLVDRAMARSEDRRRRKRSTTSNTTMNDTIGGLLA